MNTSLSLSFIILNWNRAEDLGQLLASIIGQLDKDDEIIVVDNGSTDNSVALVQRNFPGVTTVPLQENLGVSGFDVGVGQAKGTYVVLLDNDTILPEGTTAGIRKAVEKHPGYTVFALNMVTPDGVRQKDYLPQKASSAVPWHNFIGGGVVFLTSVYKRLGGYEPTYFIYINETEYAARLLLAGEKILFCPAVKIIHKTSPAARISSLSYYYYIRNSILFMKTYFRLIKRIDLLIGFLLINFKISIKDGHTGTYIRGLYSGIVTRPFYKPAKKLHAQLASVFAGSWQGNPALSHILKKKLCKK